MSTQEIVEVVGELVVDDGKALGQHHGSQALAVARDMRTELASRLQEDEMHAMIWQQFRNAPEARASYLVTAVEELLSADAALAQRLDALLEQYQRATQSADRQVDTGGGAYVWGSVSVEGGDFVGRDKRTVSITGDGNVVGDHSRATVTKRKGLGAEEVQALFDQALDLAHQKPPEVREDLEAAVETVQEEAEAGEDADKRLLNKALDVLLEEGPDVLEIVLEAVLNPAAAAGKGARMLAKRAKKSLAKKRKSS
jgi:hypothetical protein